MLIGSSEILARISKLLPSLPPAQQRVAEATLSDPSGTAASTISELADRCNTSETTVIRLCRELGFDGYPAFRLAVASAVGEETAGGRSYVSGEILPDDTPEDVASKVGAVAAMAVSATAQQLDLEALDRCVSSLVSARNIDLYGVGASGLVAQDLHQKLGRIGIRSSCSVDPHAALVSASLLTEDDVAVAFTHTGTTAETIRYLRTAHGVGATTVAVTNFPSSPISEFADTVLTTSVRETTYRTGAMASRIAQLVLVDIVFVLVARQDPERTRQILTSTYEVVRST